MRQSVVFIFIALCFFACEKDQPKPDTDFELESNFSIDEDGWTGDFADYPAGSEDFYELDYKRTALPQPLDQSQNALFLNGSNRSDDLFMFLKKQVTGLTPNQTFDVTFELEIASREATNAIGIGGAPAESVFLKVGVTQVEPQKVKDANDFYLLNVDKGIQSNSGVDAQVIGHIGVDDTTTQFTLIERTNEGTPFRFTTDNSGTAWLLIGTDSGYEGITSLYYNKIKVEFTPVLD